MPSPKAFLLQECDNVAGVLEETLRNKYGSEGSRDFYEECRVRLNFIRQELHSCNDNDARALDGQSGLLNELSKLIWRIERSSLGEYSWPFVDQLKKLAASVCSEATLDEQRSVPLIHVMANGGLDAYAIYQERRRPSGSQKRILTIVFPRSLKHFVLLHSILGHEIGHAIFACSQQQQQLTQVLNTSFCVPGSAFESAEATGAWLFSNEAPPQIQVQLQNMAGATAATFFEDRAEWGAWVEELLCDFIGVLTFGPSFIAAECHLLYALDPSGLRLGPYHPPVAVRANLMLRYAKALGFDDVASDDVGFRTSLGQFWDALNGYRIDNAWFDPVPDGALNNTLVGIAGVLQAHPLASYAKPPIADLLKLHQRILNYVPPVGYSIVNRDIVCQPVDFRHVLYAGWIASKNTTAPDFLTINRLCEHAIMQQCAVDLQLERGEPT